MNGKGSRRRKSQISDSEMEKRWDAIDWGRKGPFPTGELLTKPTMWTEPDGQSGEIYEIRTAKPDKEPSC